MKNISLIALPLVVFSAVACSANRTQEQSNAKTSTLESGSASLEEFQGAWSCDFGGSKVDFSIKGNSVSGAFLAQGSVEGPVKFNRPTASESNRVATIRASFSTELEHDFTLTAVILLGVDSGEVLERKVVAQLSDTHTNSTFIAKKCESL